MRVAEIVCFSEGSSCADSDESSAVAFGALSVEFDFAVGLVFCTQLGHTKTAIRHTRWVRKVRMDKGIVLFLKAIVGGLPHERQPRLLRTVRWISEIVEFRIGSVCNAP